MTKPLLAILLLLPLSVSAGELDGKGLVCEDQMFGYALTGLPSGINGFWFADNKVVRPFFSNSAFKCVSRTISISDRRLLPPAP